MHTHSWVGEWYYFPAILCHQSILRNAQCDFTTPKSHPQGGFLFGKMAIMLSHNLQ